ncbi:hypothetical protein KAR91_27075 [Candidatus Pacearchaeota archaeon]|nr:hypothetical protein [Candidatus Pacearchaeota archaeon]
MDGLNRDSSPDLELVKTALDKIRDEQVLKNARTGKATADNPVVFTQGTASNAAVISTVQGGGGYFNKTTDDLATQKGVAIKSPTPKTTIIADFKKDLDISRTFMADQQHGSVAKAIRGQIASWMASRDRNAFLVYANGFSVQNTIDGVNLFSDAHINENGDTVDNLESGALTDTTLNTSVVSLRDQINQTGVKVGYEPDFLLTSNAGHKNAQTVAKSVLRSGTGNNDLNYFSELFPGMQVVYNQHLDETSTTAYFLGAQNHGVERFVRQALGTWLIDWKTQRNDVYIYKLRAREEVDSIEYSGVLGSTGA